MRVSDPLLMDVWCRRKRAAMAMQDAGLDILVVTAPENIYYLTGLDHFGYSPSTCSSWPSTPTRCSSPGRWSK